MATIQTIGDLIHDQSTGLQDDDILFTDLDPAFSAYIAGLGLSQDQLDYADSTGAAEQDGLITVQAAVGEVVTSLFFAPLNGAATGLTAIDGGAITLTTTAGGQAVEMRDADGDVVGVFWIIPGADNLTGDIQMVLFEPVTHPDSGNPDDRVDFGDFLSVRATSYIDEVIGDDVFEDDDGPAVTVSGTFPLLVVDETDLLQDDSDAFSSAFVIDPGTDGPGATPDQYTLTTPGGDSGLIDTATQEAVILVQVDQFTVQGQISGGVVVFSAHVDGTTGEVSLDQQRAVVHLSPLTENEFVSLAPDALVLHVQTYDADDDSAVGEQPIGDRLQFFDDAPSIETTGDLPTLLVDDEDFSVNATGDFSQNFVVEPSNDTGGNTGTSYFLSIGAPGSGLFDVAKNQVINLAIVGGAIEARNADGDLAFSISVDANGVVTLDQSRAVTHPLITDPNDIVQFLASNLIVLNAVTVDGDGDFDTASLDITGTFRFADDAPSITVPSSAPDAASAIHVGNAVGQSATGDIGFDIGNDSNDYANGDSDFANMALAGTVIGDGPLLSPTIALASENDLQATFNWSGTFDADPNQAGDQLDTVAGTLTFDKVNDTFTVAVTDEAEGFSFSVLHTNELLAKAPPGNTGHPELVVTELDTDTPGGEPDGFYVQFSSNSLLQNGAASQFSFLNPPQLANGAQDDINTADHAFNNGDLITNSHLDWVSATQTTNGVAGDTIQKGELLTLRFFDTNILGTVNPNAAEGGTELLDPTTATDGIAIKFDGIGNAEDLVVVLNLIDGDGNETTKSIVVQNSDLIKGNANVPAPYNTEFTLDNNDALLIIEANDYNLAGEDYQIQGVQIMQSANGLTGTGINLNGGVGETGGSSGTQAWDPTDNDVLKITDIGFIQTTTGTQDVALDFSFQINDGDGDLTETQHINALVSSDFIV